MHSKKLRLWSREHVEAQLSELGIRLGKPQTAELFDTILSIMHSATSTQVVREAWADQVLQPFLLDHPDLIRLRPWLFHFARKFSSCVPADEDDCTLHESMTSQISTTYVQEIVNLMVSMSYDIALVSLMRTQVALTR